MDVLSAGFGRGIQFFGTQAEVKPRPWELMPRICYCGTQRLLGKFGDLGGLITCPGPQMFKHFGKTEGDRPAPGQMLAVRRPPCSMAFRSLTGAYNQLGSPVVLFGGGFPYKYRLQKKGYPYSNLSTGGPCQPSWLFERQ